MPTALVILYWLWTGISVVVLTGRGVRRMRARRERRRAWQSLGARATTPDTPSPAVEVAALDAPAGVDPPDELVATDVALEAGTALTSDGPDAVLAVPSPSPTVVPDGPPKATRAAARPRPLDDLIVTPAPGVAEVLAGVRLPDDFVPVIDDVVAAAAGRCLRFDTPRSLPTTRADLVTALAAAGIDALGEGADELVARRGGDAVRITLAQAPPTPERPLPAVRVELATLS